MMAGIVFSSMPLRHGGTMSVTAPGEKGGCAIRNLYALGWISIGPWREAAAGRTRHRGSGAAHNADEGREEGAGAGSGGRAAAYNLRNVGGKNFVTPITDQGAC